MHFVLWTKGSHESTNFDTLKVLWWKLAKFFMSFSKPQVSFSFLLGQTLHSLHKRDQSKCRFFRLLSSQITIHQIFVIFETTNQFSFKFFYQSWVPSNITPMYFLSWSIIYFDQKQLIKAQIFWDFRVLGSKFVKFLMSVVN